jgi:hypothetical protein
VLKFGAGVEVRQEQKCIKLKVSGQSGVQLKGFKSWRTKFLNKNLKAKNNVILKTKRTR